MLRQEALEEYLKALRLGQREYKDLHAAKKDPHPQVLDEILPANTGDVIVSVGVKDIPAEQIVGTKSAGRITAFTPSFLPLLSQETEFSLKWVDLCLAHMSDEGIREPIVCFEYLGNFYVQEGNKRVSVLRYFGAGRITAEVHRIMPPKSDDPRIRAYYEFLDFYKATGLYDIQFRKPGDYARLLAHLGKAPEDAWTEREIRALSSYLHYFREAFAALGGQQMDLRPEEALLLWLQVHPYQDLGELSGAELKKTMSALWSDLRAATDKDGIVVKTAPNEKQNLLDKIINILPEHLTVAFVHQRTPETSPWTQAHDEGRQYLELAFGKRITVHSYFGADSTELAEAALEMAVTEGAQVIFTTTPQLSRATLKVAVKHPKVRFLNCSVDQPFSSIRTYYSRVFEGKFITGAIAGAMAENDRIGYIGSSPIFGVPASINAFALGALMTNPRAKIELKWSCLGGTPAADLIGSGIRVISNRDVPTTDQRYLAFCQYGTYLVGHDGSLIPLGSPTWVWGKFYEKMVQSILSGTYDDAKGKAVNYWWGMDSGVIDVTLSDQLPTGVRSLADMLRKGIQMGLLAPFHRHIMDQNGNVINDGSRTLTTDELLHMDWLCSNVIGSIPSFDEIQPFARSMVRKLGIYRDEIPADKEELI